MTDTDTIDGFDVDARPARDDVLKPGATIDDRYEVLDVLGHGGCAVVYRVFDRTLRQELALKRLRPDRSAPDQSMRLRREVRYAREVRSEHLVRIYDVSADQDQPYITMELVEGETLAERLRRDGALPVEEALRISREVLLALQALHDHGIVHRDVKPGNVLLTHRGDVRLGDLGLARTLAGDESAMTNPDSVVGTWQYISPEQALGATIVPESDLYSFGIVLYEMLTGRLPFDCDSSVGYLTAHLTQPPRRLRAERADVPRWLDRIVARLLEKRPQHRYGSAAEIEKDLSSGRATSRGRLMRPIGAAAALILLIVAGILGYQWWSSRFSELVESSSGGVEALDRQGRSLWIRDDLKPHVTASYKLTNDTGIATIEKPGADATSAERLRVSILNPQTGRRTGTVDLPSGAELFLEMPDRYFPNQMRVIDIDHDGNEELHLTYTHHYWPSYSVVWNPAGGERSVTFAASGHHRFAGTADVNDDGIDELLYIGINNRMGWNWALAAVSLGTRGDLFSRETQSWSPDANRGLWNRDGLLWYSLLPKDARWTPMPTIDHERQLVLVSRQQKPPMEITFSGFERSSESALTDSERNQRRREAYARMREASRFLLAQEHQGALRALDNALQLAADTSDPVLRIWLETLRLRALIGAGSHREAETVLSRIVADQFATPSDIHWEAAKSYHLAGELRRAFDHYKSGMALRSTDYGRFTREFAIGGVMALVELQEFERASAFVDAFERSDHYSGPDAEYLRRYVLWASGSKLPPLEEIPGFTLYEFRYWNLEQRRQSVPPEDLLAEVDALLDRSAELTPMILSLKADLLYELGRKDEAEAVSTEAIREMHAEIRHNVFVRPHRDLIESRHEKVTR